MHTHVRRTLTLLADLILTLPNDPYPLYERVAVMAGIHTRQMVARLRLIFLIFRLSCA